MRFRSISAFNSLPAVIPNHDHCSRVRSSDNHRPKGNMTTEEKLTELLRRAYAVIGEGLIENALDESAAGLHNEIGELFGLAPAKRDTVRCGKTWFTAGGRDERQCRESAVNVCAECGNARCDEHDDLGFEEYQGRILCEECRPAPPKLITSQ
jgi:hypothetical protein